MNRKSPRKRKVSYSKSRKPKTRPSPKRSTVDGLKQKLNSISILLLIVVNVILISHLVHRLVTSYKPTQAQAPDIMVDAIDVEVLNGCGVTGLANVFADLLKENHYDVVRIDNADSFDYTASIVIDRGQRDRKQVEKFCKLLGISFDRILPIDSNEVQADVTLIIGADYQSLKSYRSMH